MGDVDLPVYAAAWWAWTGPTDVGYLPGAGAGWPPLLLWCIHLSWWLLGVSETAARLVASLFGLVSLWQVAALARRLWPEDAEAARYAPIILAGSGGFVAYVATTIFAWPLLSLFLLALHGLVLAWRQRPRGGMDGLCRSARARRTERRRRRGLAHAAHGAGGAVGHARRQRRALAILVRRPGHRSADRSGRRRGIDHRDLPAHADCGRRRPAGAALHPGSPVIDGRRSALVLVHLRRDSCCSIPGSGGRLCGLRSAAPAHSSPAPNCGCAWLTAAIVFLVVLVAGRQTTDLLPLLPPVALVIARVWATHAGKARDFHAAVPGLLALFVCLFFFMLNIIPVAHLDAVWQRLFDSDLPVWLGGISLAFRHHAAIGQLSAGAADAAHAASPAWCNSPCSRCCWRSPSIWSSRSSLRPFFDLEPMARKIRAFEEAGRPVAVYAHYNGEFDLTGRLTVPLQVVDDLPAALEWAAANPSGAVVSFFRGGLLHMPRQPLYLGHAEDYRAALWASETVTEFERRRPAAAVLMAGATARAATRCGRGPRRRGRIRAWDRSRRRRPGATGLPDAATAASGR